MVAPSGIYTSATTSLPGTPASLVSPQDGAYSAKYVQMKNHLCCMEFTTQGSLVKFGFSKASPPRPRFQCNQCGTIFNINHVIQMMSTLEIQPQQEVEAVILSPIASFIIDEDEVLPDAQPRPTSVEPDSQDSMPILFENTPLAPPQDVIMFLVDSVKRLTDQAAELQEKFDYLDIYLQKLNN